MEAVKQPLTTPKEPLPTAEPSATGFINRTAQTFFSKVEERRYAAGQNFFYFTPTLLPIFGMLYGGAPEEVKGDLKEFLHDDGSCDVHEAFGNWLKVPQEEETVEQKHARDFFSTPILWVTEKIRSLGMWLFPKYFPPPAPVIPTSWKTETDTGILIAHRETAKIPEKTRAALSHYCEDPVTFATNGEATEKSNAWISERTQGAIQDLVPYVDESNPIHLLLLAAASFKSNWVYPFDERSTFQGRFNNSDGTTADVQMMELAINDLRIAYHRIDGKYLRILELPMHGDLAMYVVIDDNQGADVKKYLASEAFLDVLNRVDGEESPFKKTRSLTVLLPKIDLKDRVDILSELSDDPLIQKIQQARWDGSLVETSDSRPSKITQMVSQTNLSLDETGVKIKAASYTCCGAQSCPPTFYADKPFGLVLFDKKTKTILGMGQINKLSDSKSPLFRFFLSS
ncbi:MAG: hypothetical protein H7A41_00190 [Chlamydiales bacterium]|nr:hypothetical protein [Chlamydiales bacterium]